MISRREFERKKTESFVTELFWNLETWIDSIEEDVNTPGLSQDRQELERLIRHGLTMRVSRLSLMVRDAYRRLFALPQLSEQKRLQEFWLNDEIDRVIRSHKSFFEKMGVSITVADFPRAVVQCEGGGLPVTYILWWILGAWPESQVEVDFNVDEDKVKIVFRDSNGIHTRREYTKNLSILLVWACIIEYITVVECHGQCVWPQAKGPRQLEFFLPLHPPTKENLDKSLSEIST